ncbi:MAG: TMEM143 family protein [Pirellulales bacterium]
MSTLENEPREALDRESADSSAPPKPPRREQFIPLRKTDLEETLARGRALVPSEAAAFGRFCRLLHVLVHGQFQSALEELKDAYAPFDPDADTRAGAELPQSELDERRGRLFEKFGWLLARGNFIRLAEAEINEALADRSHWGLHLTVDFELFDRLDLYYRGDTIGTRFRRRPSNPFRSEEVEVPIYQRLVVIFRLRPGRRYSKLLDTRDVYIKLFKDIPKLDLDMLLPETKVKMMLFDRLRVMLPTLSGIGIAIYKIVWLTTVALGMSLAFLLLIGGTVGYGVRSLYGYLNTKQKYQLNLTQSLYYQNIDNNAGVIHRLLDEAEEQENREVMLAYFFLWREAPADGWTPDELDRRIEQFLHERARAGIDFEIADALDKLRRFQIVETHGERLKALPIEQAIAALAKCWRALPDTLG